MLLFSLVYHLIPSSTLWDLLFASVRAFEIGALFCGFLLFSGNLYTCNHLCVTVHFQTEQISVNPRKRPDGTAGKWKGRHEEGNEALISFGSAPNNLSLVFITSLKSQRGSNLNVCFLQTHFLYPDVSSFFSSFLLRVRLCSAGPLTLGEGSAHPDVIIKTQSSLHQEQNSRRNYE